MPVPAALARYNDARAARQAGDWAGAVAAYQEALAHDPNFPEAENNLGNCLRAGWDFDGAEACFRRALSLRETYPEAWNNLGLTLKNLARADEAIPCLERAVGLAPRNAAFHSNLVYGLHYTTRSGNDPDALRRATAQWGRRHGKVAQLPPFAAEPLRGRRLRVGYVSAAFCEQSQSFFTVPLLEHHDRSAFEIFCYSDAAAADAVTARLRACADHWRSSLEQSDHELAETIRTDRIDVLVDLTLHAAGNRLPMFARKPAPVQLSWLGFPGETGLAAIDHTLTDPWLDLQGAARLPDTFWCYDPLTAPIEPGGLPALRTGALTFGCLNNFSKVNEPMLRLWRRVLDAVPESRLVLLAPPGSARDRVRSVLGIDSARVRFTEFLPRAGYLGTYRGIDLGLDTFPYNGHTTSLDSWWMGVPVVTLAGSSGVSRAGLSQASNLGLAAQFAAARPDAFVEFAVRAASDRAQLAALRATVRARMKSSPLMDAARFARAFEAILYQVSERNGTAGRPAPL